MKTPENTIKGIPLVDSTTPGKLTKQPSMSILPNGESILRRCRFASRVADATGEATQEEWEAFVRLLAKTEGGKELLRTPVSNRFDDGMDDLQSVIDGVLTISEPQLTCQMIDEASGGSHCHVCEYRGVVKSPIDFGYKPWTTKKRTLLLGGHLDEEILITEAVLATDGKIFHQNGKLVHLVRNQLLAQQSGNHASLEIQPLTSANLQERLCKQFLFLKLYDLGVAPVYPPAPLINGLLERRKYPTLSLLRGVTTVPVFREDGTVLQAPSYDSATQLYFEPYAAFPEVPEEPSPEDVKGAVAMLLDIVCDFPIADDHGKAVFLSTILTVVGRYAFRGCVPMVIIDANTPGVGKTKLADAVGLITTGSSLPRSVQSNYAEEERRQITAMLLKGQRLLLIDNIASRFGSSTLDALLTSEIWQDRVLGRSKQATLPNLLQVIATGNNMQLRADTVRRCLRIQLNSSEEHPELRSGFKYPDLERFISEHQPQLLAAALTLLRGYWAAGRPRQEIVALGSFAGWSDCIQSTVKWAFGIDPGEARISTDDEMDLDKEILDKLMSGWRSMVPDGTPISCRKVMDTVLKADGTGRDILDALEMANSTGKRSAVALGNLLGKFRKRTHKGMKFDHGRPDRTSDGRVWALISA